MTLQRQLIAAAAGALLLAQAQAQNGPELSLSGQPRSWLVQGRAWQSEGYEGARWGMSVEQVKAVIAAAHPQALATLKQQTDLETRTLGMAVVLPSLAPGPGPVTISYVFGATRHGLIAVHLTWVQPGNPSEPQRQALLKAGTELASGLVGFRWPELGTTRGQVRGPGALVLFSGRDPAGGGVEIRLDGISYDVERRGAPGQTDHKTAPPGPAGLRLSYVASLDNPDVYQIPPGSF
ncbi:hypothetical protein [Duganella levis]|uniref:Uncharacterized protein n=1 Tax=Duganella levis TaxID=2692169 RepID=A0ABW9W3F0_9BURK|nr:hypothetical protein [Duganella levis]MYN28488.1 hypothetical protein [Duganella levis]